MSSIQEKALVHLTGTANLGSINEDSLLALANEYPYFAPIQLLLSAKLKETNVLAFHAQAQKTNLYFTNPYWVHYLLSDFNSQNKAVELLDSTIASSDQVITEETVNNTEQAPIIDLTPEIGTENVIVVTNNNKIDNINESVIKTSNETVSNIQIPTIESVVELLQRINHPYEEATATAESNTKIANLLSEQLADFKKPVSEEAKLEITREPLHTTEFPRKAIPPIHRQMCQGSRALFLVKMAKAALRAFVLPMNI